MGTRVLELGVVAAVAMSALLLAAMLAAPLLPQPSAGPALPSATIRPSATATAEVTQPPIGLYLMRTPFSFGPCLAVQLGPESYPVAEGAEGTAAVLWWVRGMTGCDSRTDDVRSVTAATRVLLDEDDPDGPPIGYRLEFTVPLEGSGDAPSAAAALTILARQSTDTVLQAVEDTPGTGQGYVLDRVVSVDPPSNPLPTSGASVSASASP